MQDNKDIAVAVGLMRAALALLDRNGEKHSATRLQHAIDVTLLSRPLSTDQEIAPDLACLMAGIPLDAGADHAATDG